MSEKKPGITMKDVKAAMVTAAPKVRKPGITTNMVNAPVPAPRAVGPIVRGPMITTHDELPKDTKALLREVIDMPYAEAFAKKIDAEFQKDANTGAVTSPAHKPAGTHDADRVTAPSHTPVKKARKPKQRKA